ncbi:PorP/SprF family type IX secretion system membrane protein [Mucilaginibacter myungsuensis]|uniref:Type IX secretion system membrane protein PorP/SprF n=1 Tax=Mucilaginibacter myungsuensis TaxID=649104 RepID=A0A929KVL9_9SPHI|nr:type IX secretion system membrane protein PorP/SprF [Mucilaginibacter myungsuensis]MBE9660713.1 type IX secretion system membrane protein PorP/SprF [Mucilaginibacter myungsuensis]MDN3600758.1 type IX secretion system membrane protein PorP/SprF [Mucilaginibacter myungsuensis]
MKRLLLFCVLALAFGQISVAQQKPQYTQYVFNTFLLNPAVSGIENYADMKAGYRSQWTGLQGAPVTSYVTVHTPIGSNYIYGDANAAPGGGGTDPYSRSYLQDYQAAEPHHGIGFMLVSDKAGPISQTNLNFTYAYHLGLTDKLNLSVGVSAGMNNISLNTSQITLENEFDPAISNGNNNQWKPDVGVGVWAYSGSYFVGASVQQLLKQDLYFNTNSNLTKSQTVPHYLLTAGLKLPVSDELTLMPSVLVKVIDPVPTTFDVNMKMAFRDIFWLGGSYRKDDSFGALLGLNLNSSINIGYSYDFTTSALRTVSNGSHEIVIGILLNNRYKVRSPQHGF